VALAPLNLGLTSPLDLEGAERVVEAELLRSLAGRGLRVGLLHPEDAERAWRASLPAEETGAPPVERLDRMAAAFALRLGRDSDFEFDYLMLPSLAFREAQVRGRIARWDGVRRRVQPRRARGASQAHYFREWEGHISGLSLHVRVYDRDGRRVHVGWGGLDLTHDPVVVGSAMSGGAIPQSELLGNVEHVREGVAHALEGFPAPAAP
jgi:hypothetical protein